MAWKIEFSRDSLRFLGRQTSDVQESVRSSLLALLDSLNKNIVPSHLVDIERLKGRRDGFLRLRTGGVRIILKLQTDTKTLRIYALGYREDVYKK
jgi:mRNA-degrading endonuclease RelE of RelBE toxin-antitoxin system